MIGGTVVGKVTFDVKESGLTTFISKMENADQQLSKTAILIGAVEAAFTALHNTIKTAATSAGSIKVKFDTTSFSQSIRHLNDKFQSVTTAASGMNAELLITRNKIYNINRQLGTLAKNLDAAKDAAIQASLSIKGVSFNMNLSGVAIDLHNATTGLHQFATTAQNFHGFHPNVVKNLGSVAKELLRAATNASQLTIQFNKLGHSSVLAANRLNQVLTPLKGVSKKSLTVDIKVVGGNDPTLQWLIHNSNRTVTVRVNHTTTGNPHPFGGGGAGGGGGGVSGAGVAAGLAIAPWLRRFGRGLGVATGITGGLAMGAGYGISQVLDSGRQLQGADAQLLAVSRDLNNYVVNRDFISKESNKLGVSRIESARAYAQMFGAAKNKFEDAQIRTAFSSATSYMLANRLSPEQQKGAMIAINQMFSKNQVTAEELKGQLAEHGLPGVVELFSKAAGFGTDVKKLMDEMKKGKVGSDVLFKALLLMGKESTRMTDEKGRNPVEMYQQSSQAQQERAKNAWAEFSLQVMDSGLDKLVSKIFSDLVDALVAVKPYAKAFSKWLYDTYTGFKHIWQGLLIFKKILVGLFDFMLVFSVPFVAAFTGIIGATLGWRMSLGVLRLFLTGAFANALMFVGAIIKRHPIIATLSAVLFVSNQLSKYYKGEDSWFTLFGAGFQLLFSNVDYFLTLIRNRFILFRAFLFDIKEGIVNTAMAPLNAVKDFFGVDRQVGSSAAMGFDNAGSISPSANFSNILKSMSPMAQPSPASGGGLGNNLSQSFSLYVDKGGLSVTQGSLPPSMARWTYESMGQASFDTFLPV